MSIDLSALCSPLQSTDVPDLDAADERLVEMDTLAGKERWGEVAEKASALVAEGIYDVRFLPYLFLQAFLADGYPGLASVLAATDNLLGQSFLAARPSRRKEGYFNKRLSWLWGTIDAAMEYHEKHSTKEHAAWQSTLDEDVLAQALSAGAGVAEKLAAGPYEDASQKLGALLARLRRQEPVVARAPSPPPPSAAAEPEPAPMPTPRESAARLPPSKSEAPRAEGEPMDPLLDDGRAIMKIAVSRGFLDLCRKLAAFEALVSQGKFDRAAVLAADLAQTIDSFDPRVNFPELFAPFAALQSRYVRELMEHAEEPDSPVFRALQQHCRVDLKGFVEAP